jgi:hypothetical protein
MTEILGSGRWQEKAGSPAVQSGAARRARTFGHGRDGATWPARRASPQVPGGVPKNAPKNRQGRRAWSSRSVIASMVAP